MSTAYETARAIALTLLGDQVATEVDVIHAVESAASIVGNLPGGDAIDLEALRREVESKVRVWVGVAGVLEDSRGHEDWLPGRRAEIDWRFWLRYKRYLQESEALPAMAILRLDDLTDRILGRLEDPRSRWAIGIGVG